MSEFGWDERMGLGLAMDGKRIGRCGIDTLIYYQWNWNKWLMATLLRSEIVAVIGSIRNRCVVH